MNILENKIGFISFICGLFSVFSITYMYFSHEMTDGLSETPDVLVQSIVLFTQKESAYTVMEPSLTSSGGDLTDEVKRSYAFPIIACFILLTFVLAVIGKIKNENSFYYAVGVLGAVSATSIIDVRLFLLCCIAILFATLGVNKVKEYNNSVPRS